MAAAPPAKPPITCHVLDTTLGRPAPSIPVTLTLHNPPTALSTSPLKYSSTTNSDGRVTAWTPASPFSSETLESVFSHEEGGEQIWSLRFDTDAYFGRESGGSGGDSGRRKAFFPVVEVTFRVEDGQRKGGEHFHVPVLLGPFGFTTYRGS